MAIGLRYAQLQEMTDGELIEKFDSTSKSSQVGVTFFIEELRIRAANRQAKRLERMTWAVVILSAVMTVSTLVQLFLAARS